MREHCRNATCSQKGDSSAVAGDKKRISMFCSKYRSENPYREWGCLYQRRCIFVSFESVEI